MQKALLQIDLILTMVKQSKSVSGGKRLQEKS